MSTPFFKILLAVIFGGTCWTVNLPANAQFVKDAGFGQQASSIDGSIGASCRKPVYPRAAQLKQAEGTVTLGFLIGVNGKVLDAKVKKSSGNADLDDAALISLSKCRFAPAVIDGKTVEAWSYIQYVWSLEETGF